MLGEAPHFWGQRINRALKHDQSADSESTGETRHLDAMYQALESELERYQGVAAVRDLNPLLLSEIDRARQKHKSDCARIQEYRVTAQEARTAKPSNDWPDNYLSIVGSVQADRVLRHLGMRQTGRRWVCPRCQKVENTGRGTIDANGPKWYCFSCKEGGIAPTLLQHAGYNYQDSISLCLELV